ncbi:MAG: hypothetical protein ABJN65_00960 [Parasphingorhabdus sp.]
MKPNVIKNAVTVTASLFLGLTLSVPTQAAIVESSSALITSITSFSEYGGGDVVVKIANPVTGCEAGHWLRPADPGFDRNVALLMSAYLANRPVKIYSHNNQIWPGSSGKYCLVDLVSI